jgi:hypothetical protein
VGPERATRGPACAARPARTNGDGKADLLWSDAGGRVAMWFMNGIQVSQQAYAPSAPGWTAIGTGDFNGDGMGDILWQDSTANLAIWLIATATAISCFTAPPVP